jgi:hypothetical protein
MAADPSISLQVEPMTVAPTSAGGGIEAKTDDVFNRAA